MFHFFFFFFRHFRPTDEPRTQILLSRWWVLKFYIFIFHTQAYTCHICIISYNNTWRRMYTVHHCSGVYSSLLFIFFISPNIIMSVFLYHRRWPWHFYYRCGRKISKIFLRLLGLILEYTASKTCLLEVKMIALGCRKLAPTHHHRHHHPSSDYL